jgi:hypothetical protein
MAGAGVEDQVDGSGVLGGLAQVAADAGPVIPLGLRLACLEWSGKNESGGPKRVEMVCSRAYGNVGELFDGRKAVGFAREDTILFGRKAEGKGPQGVLDIWIAMASVDEHGAGAVSEVLDAALRNTILMVGVNSAEGDGLFRIGYCFSKLFSSEDAIVTVVVFDCDVMHESEALKGLLSRNCIVTGRHFLSMYVVQA